MYIIDKNKDYYDYLKGTYGIDKTIVYDRRGSIVLSNQYIIDYLRKEYHRLESIEHFILEIGDKQYLFSAKLYYKKEGFLYVSTNGVFNLEKIFNDNKHYFEKEITIVSCNLENFHYSYNFMYKGYKVKEFNYSSLSWADVLINENRLEQKIDNPILSNTCIPHFIPAKDIWISLMNYISSKYNDKTIDIKNSDVDKIVNHGFDKKTSFRNPIKWNKE
jgi:hypothetical protein